MILAGSIALGLYAIFGLIILRLVINFHPDNELAFFDSLWLPFRFILTNTPYYVSHAIEWILYPFEYSWKFAKYDHPVIAFLVWFFLIMAVIRLRLRK